MRTILIFYLANRTAINQKLLNSNIMKIGLSIDKIMVATSVRGLIKIFEKNLNNSDLVFIIGGLNVRWEINILNLMSYFLSFSVTKKEDMIKNSVELAKDTLFIEAKNQNFVILSSNVDYNSYDYILNHLSNKYNLKKIDNFSNIENKKEWFQKDFDKPKLEKPPLITVSTHKTKNLDRHNIRVCFKIFTLMITFIISILLSIIFNNLF